MSKNKKFFIGTAFAAAAGLVAGLLVAPKSGKGSRKSIA
jgi:gas vesicle protein